MTKKYNSLIIWAFASFSSCTYRKLCFNNFSIIFSNKTWQTSKATAAPFLLCLSPRTVTTLLRPLKTPASGSGICVNSRTSRPLSSRKAMKSRTFASIRAVPIWPSPARMSEFTCASSGLTSGSSMITLPWRQESGLARTPPTWLRQVWTAP